MSGVKFGMYGNTSTREELMQARLQTDHGHSKPAAQIKPSRRLLDPVACGPFVRFFVPPICVPPTREWN
jgi:hypothetical protein